MFDLNVDLDVHIDHFANSFILQYKCLLAVYYQESFKNKYIIFIIIIYTEYKYEIIKYFNIDFFLMLRFYETVLKK